MSFRLLMYLEIEVKDARAFLEEQGYVAEIGEDAPSEIHNAFNVISTAAKLKRSLNSGDTLRAAGSAMAFLFAAMTFNPNSQLAARVRSSFAGSGGKARNAPANEIYDAAMEEFRRLLNEDSHPEWNQTDYLKTIKKDPAYNDVNRERLRVGIVEELKGRGLYKKLSRGGRAKHVK